MFVHTKYPVSVCYTLYTNNLYYFFLKMSAIRNKTPIFKAFVLFFEIITCQQVKKLSSPASKGN